MSGRHHRHRTPGVVRVICTDPYHQDTPEFTQRGHHYIDTLKLWWKAGQPNAGLAWRGDRPKAEAVVGRMDGGGSDHVRPIAENLGLMWRNAQRTTIVKDYRRADSLWVFRFRCPCGRDVQRLESYLVELVLRYSAANPAATRFDLDITII